MKTIRLCCLLAVLCAGVVYCHVLRAYKFRHLSLTDHARLPSVRVEKGGTMSPFIEASDSARFAPMWQQLDSALANTYTAACMVIRHDSILYEQYFNGFDRQSLLPSFSVAKSFVGTLIGIALAEGSISSLQDPVTRYLPELLQSDPQFARITLQHLLDMRSGIRWSEGSYGLKDDAIKMGFRPNMHRYVMKIKTAVPPGGDFNYQSINTLLLSMVIEKTTGRSTAQYLQEKIWQPLGMESDATWNTDKRKMIIAYGALNATARDFAKLGRLYLNKGVHQGRPITSPAWIESTVSADSMRKYNDYRNQWWGKSLYKTFKDSLQAAAYCRENAINSWVRGYVTRSGAKQYYIVLPEHHYYAEGILGQFVYVVPHKQLIIVRLGHHWRHPQFQQAESYLQKLAEAF